MSPPRVAVLVNEFGEVGIDAALLEGAKDTVTLRELAGGCLCCTLGLPMVIAVTQLLARARPDRLVIEMSGLGHAGGLVDALTAPPLSEHVVVTRVITLVDPRAWAAGRLDREPFASQIDAADVLVLHKVDLASKGELDEARRRADAMWPSRAAVVEATHGDVDLRWLIDDEGNPTPRRAATGMFRGRGHEHDSRHAEGRRHGHEHGHEHEHEHEHEDVARHGAAGTAPHSSHGRQHDPIPETASSTESRHGTEGGSAAAFIDVHVGRGEGYVTFGVQLPPSDLVEPSGFRAWVDTLPAGSRLKAVLRLGEHDGAGGVLRSRWIALQVADGDADEREAVWRKDSRLEVLVPVAALGEGGEHGFVARLRAVMRDGVAR